jgi:hypothetical protein
LTKRQQKVRAMQEMAAEIPKKSRRNRDIFTP